MDNASFFSKYRCLIQNILQEDNLTIDSLEGEFNCQRQLSFIHRYLFLLYFFLAIFSNIVFGLLSVKKRLSQYKNDDFLFFSCPDPVFRTKNIMLLADGLNYSMVYLPNMHVLSSLHYYMYFKNNKVKVFFPTVTIKDVLCARNVYRKLGCEIKEKRTEDYIRFKYTISIFLIYRNMADRLINGINDYKGKCILEHQKFYFMPIVVGLRKKGLKTTMMQHGLFYQPVFDYIPLLCDKVLCCSEREKSLYIDCGTKEECIKVFGAPLQTLTSKRADDLELSKYNLLVLMTVVTEDNTQIIKDILNHISSSYNKVLVRLRPRSRKDDLKKIGDVFQGMTISSPKNTLVDDIISSSKVVSFSVDANVEVAKLHKPMVYVWTEGLASEVKDINCATQENYQEEIKKLMTEKFYSTFTEAQYKEILGETDVAILKNRFKKYVNS